jgi:aryl-alcohol dehydrogenase-like predicted oxidoreductase
MIAGAATAEGTTAFAARVGGEPVEGRFRRFGGRLLSSLGLGTYLGPDDAATDVRYREAAARALELGINVLDTSVNYRSQRSERVLGEVLAAAIGAGKLARNEVLVTTKGGFLPFDGQRPRDAAAYFQETYLDTGLIAPDELVANCHSLAPRFLADQLERSRRNLGLDTLDVYYLHNPETQLGEVDRPEFLRRMRAAFELLEHAVSDGKIGCYGTATWSGYRQPRDAEDLLRLEELLVLAREVGGADHHFRMVQLPYNLAMTEAFALANQGATSLLTAAADAGVYVMTSGSILQGKLTRQLPDEMRAVLGAHLETDAQRALEFVRSTPGVGTALCGMKTLAHVEENAEILARAPLPPAVIRDMLA